jgi:hypothetical protein
VKIPQEDIMENNTQEGILALKAGDKARARLFLRLALEQNPDDARAWLWLSGAVETDQDRLECLYEVSRIEPQNAAALKGIQQLENRGIHIATPWPAQPEPAPLEIPLEQNLPEITAKPAAVPEAAPASVPAAADIPPALEEKPFERPTAAPAVENTAPQPADAAAAGSGSDEVGETQEAVRPEERILARFKPSLLPTIMLGGSGLLSAFFIGAAVILRMNGDLITLLVVIGFLALAFLLFAWMLILRATSRYLLTNRRVILETGVFKHKRSGILLKNIKTVTGRKNLFAGTVVIEAVKGRPVKLAGQSNPNARAHQLQRAVTTNGEEA